MLSLPVCVSVCYSSAQLSLYKSTEFYLKSLPHILGVQIWNFLSTPMWNFHSVQYTVLHLLCSVIFLMLSSSFSMDTLIFIYTSKNLHLISFCTFLCTLLSFLMCFYCRILTEYTTVGEHTGDVYTNLHIYTFIHFSKLMNIHCIQILQSFRVIYVMIFQLEA